MAKTTTTKPKAAKRVAKKRPSPKAQVGSHNGQPMGQMSEETKELTLRAFRKVYESHHRKTA